MENFMADVLITKQNRTILNILACHSQGICFAGKKWIIESKYNFLVSLKIIIISLALV